MIRNGCRRSVILSGLAISILGADLQQLLTAYRTAPSDWRLCYQIGLQYVELQELNQALSFFAKASAVNPQFVPARKNQATVLWFLGRRKESEQAFLKILPLAPADPTVHFYLAMASHERKQYVTARSHFSRAGSLASDNPEAIPALVESFLKSGDTAILPHAIGTLRSSPVSLDQVIRTAEILLDNRKFAHAITLLADLGPDNAAITALLARAYDGAGENDRAYSTYVHAVQLSPSDENYLALSLFAIAHQNSLLALDFVRKGLAAAPNSPGLLLNEGILLALSGSRSAAEGSLQHAARTKPGWSDPIICLGILKLEAGDFTEAALDFRNASQRDPKDFRGPYLLAVALSRTGDDASQLVTDSLAVAIRLAESDARPHVLLGQTYLRLGNLELAKRSLEHALRLDSTNSAAVYQLGLLYRRLGNQTLATKYMNQFRALKDSEGSQQSELVQVLKIRRN